MDTILEIDKDLLIWINSFHADWLDPIIFLATKTAFWTPLYLVFIFLIFKNFERDAWFILVTVALIIVLADQFTSSIMKPLFQRLRPSRDPSIQDLLHMVINSKGNLYRGGQFGFASSHAANTFGTATFLWLLFKDKSKWIGLVFLWPTIVSYTRLYLGVHFPGDVLVGAMVGVLCGMIGFKFFNWVKAKREMRTVAKE